MPLLKVSAQLYISIAEDQQVLQTVAQELYKVAKLVKCSIRDHLVCKFYITDFVDSEKIPTDTWYPWMDKIALLESVDARDLQCRSKDYLESWFYIVVEQNR